MIIDLTAFILVTAITTLVGLGLLYFVVKSAIKNALHEDRLFQAKIAKMKADKR
ncbi:hypothetical protein [Microbacterium sp. GCS4]|uniref:hypothetical protein n=1 Tax=Microbacterium sp. GCS4 TaxID=1692239 RepID=UPI000A48F3AC|nr:hypothetical protein [Microbacterium sp. GCS4]